eukprot:4348481-Prymnesium_polylepis.1
MFDHPTARQLAIHLKGSVPNAVDAELICKAAFESDGKLIKVDGLGITLPQGVSRISSLRKMGHGGNNLLFFIPVARWDVKEAASDLRGLSPEVLGRVRHGGFLMSSELFENAFFSISNVEAAAMDPQQRQLLERGYMALHASGTTKGELMGATVAVNVGQWASDFGNVLLPTPAGRGVYASTGIACSVTCGRVSFVLGLQGPCGSYDTACSASLVANHGSM